MKLKILTLNYEFPPIGGGASPVTFQLCKHLVLAGHKVDVVTMHYKDLPRFEKLEGINIYRTPAIRKWPNICYTHEMATYLLGAIRHTLNLTKQQQYNIIHCHFIIPTGLLALLISKMAKIPYILTTHGSDVPGYNPDRFQLQHKFTKPILKKICKNAGKIICPSIYLKKLILKNIGNYNILHIPNGIDLENFNPDLNRPKENIILATGRLLKRKGFQTLIKAVHDVELPLEVHIAGDGPYRTELEKLSVGSKTKIIFHGWIKDSKTLIQLYEKASIYVLISSHENASISLLEAMAAKCAVITSNVTGCPETVGKAGLLIDVDDYRKLTEILVKLSKNKKMRKQYAKKAHERITRNFLWEKIVKQYEKAYSGILNPTKQK